MNCISGPYRDVYYNEIINVMKEINFDALYIDQIGNCFKTICFNKKYNHPVGGEDHYVKTDNKLIKDLELKNKSLYKTKEVYPVAGQDTDIKEITGKMTLLPDETKLILVY